MEPIRIETVLGPYECQDGDVWDAHIHLWCRPHPDVSTDPDLYLQNEFLVEAELQRFKAAGGGIVVEFTPLDYHRNAEAMMRISASTGVHVLMGTGFYRSPGVDYYFRDKDTRAVTRRLAEEVTYGDDKTGARASFYKWATSLDDITEMEYKVLDMVVEAYGRAKAPISTHCQRGRHAAKQMRLLTQREVAPGDIVIGHLDMIQGLTLDMLLEVLEGGVNISFDQLGKPKYGDDETKIELIRQLCERGYQDHILCGSDIGRFTCLQETGGTPGYAHIPGKFRQELNAAGFEPDLIKKLTERNPAHVYRSRR